MPRIEGRTGYAIKNAQTALGDDITESGAPELTNALNHARTSYAQSKAAESLDNVIQKHVVEMDGGKLNFPSLEKGLKNWSMTEDGRNAIKFTPGLKEDITKLRALIKKHPELKSVISDPKQINILPEFIRHPLQSLLFHNNIGGAVGGAIGTAINPGVGTAVGVAAGKAAQSGIEGVAGAAGRAVLKSAPVKQMFKKSIEKAVAPTQVSKISVPTVDRSGNAVESIVNNVTPTVTAPKWEGPTFTDHKLIMPKEPTVPTQQLALPAPNPVRTVRPGIFDRVGNTKDVPTVSETVKPTAPSKVDGLINKVKSNTEDKTLNKPKLPKPTSNEYPKAVVESGVYKKSVYRWLDEAIGEDRTPAQEAYVKKWRSKHESNSKGK